MSNIHPTMAAALAPFAPPHSEVHQIAALPGLEVSEATHADFVDSMAGDLELVPVEQDEAAKKLQRAGFAAHPSRRSSDREEAAAYHAHRNEVNARDTDNLGLWK